jgi:hypothetical protein
MRQPHLNPIQKVIAPPQPQTAIAQHSPHPIEQLQSAIGNQAVNQLLASQPRLQAKPMFRGLSHELLIQPKLAIGVVGDKYEQEADRVAEQVVSQMNAPENSAIQRQEMLKEENDDDDIELRMKPIVQRLSDADGMTAAPELETSIEQAKGSGQPLADVIRQPMERSLGADFSEVKVHTDDRSHQLNRSIQSKAFTTGRNIFFRQGEYNPGSRGGQELIAHELTHVVQQNGRHNSKVEPESKSANRSISSIQTAPTSIQAKIGRPTRVQANAQPLKTWDFEKNKCNISIQLHKAEPGAESDFTWKLTLYEDGKNEGHISIYYYKKTGILKPDGLEVTGNGKSKGYGGILGEYVVMAMKEPSIQAETKKAGRLELNLVNPISAHLSVKALNSTMNNAKNIEDPGAYADAEKAIDELPRDDKNAIKTRGYRVENFPRFWGWVADLAKNHDVEFKFSYTSTYTEIDVNGELQIKNKSFPTLDRHTNFSLDMAQELLGWLTSIKINRGVATGFVLNVYSPLPPINED